MADEEKVPGENEAAVISGCSGLGALLFIMGYCGMLHGFWGAVMGTGLGLLAFLVVTEMIYRVVLIVNRKEKPEEEKDE